MNGGDNVVESDEIITEDAEVICNEPDYAVLHPNMLQNLMDDYYTEKATKTKIPIEMEAAIELLSMLRQSNLSLYTKIVKWTKHHYIKNNNAGKPPCFPGSSKQFLGALLWFGMSSATQV